LTLALFFAAVVVLVEHGQPTSRAASARAALVSGALAGGALALVLECHVAFAVLVPVLLAAAGSARRPVHTTLAAGCALATGLFVDGRTAWIANARAVAALGGLVPGIVVLAVAFACGMAARSRLSALSGAARCSTFLFTAGLLSIGAAVALRPYAGAANAARYLAPALALLAIAGALVFVATTGALARVARLGNGGAWWLRLGLCAAAVVAVLPLSERPSPKWSLNDAATVAPAILARAPASALGERLQTRSPTIPGAMALFRSDDTQRPHDLGQDLILLKQSKQQAAPPGPWVTEIDLGASRALVGAIDPFLDRTRMQACYEPLDGASEAGGCVTTHTREEAVSPEEQAYPASRAAREAFPPDVLRRFEGVHERFVARIAPRQGPPHVLAILSEDRSWTIEAVSGVAYAGELPARRVTLESREGEGSIVLGRRTAKGATPPDRYWAPATVEMDVKDATLADAVLAGAFE
jgi:hypothetical protein